MLVFIHYSCNLLKIMRLRHTNFLVLSSPDDAQNVSGLGLCGSLGVNKHAWLRKLSKQIYLLDQQ